MDPIYNRTEFHPLALALTLAMGVAMLMVRRERAIVPLLIVACFIPHMHRIVIGGIDVSMLRLAVFFGWARVLSRDETRLYRHHRMDTALIVWLVLGTFAFAFGPRGSIDNFVNRLGVMVDVAGSYFLVRILLRDVPALRFAIAVYGWMAVIISIPMLIEHVTGSNLFSVLGGVPARTVIRDGRLRCQGAFSHPILAGDFGATVAPLFVALWLAYPRQRVQQTLFVGAATAITIFSASSGPLLSLIGALLGWMLWPARGRMRQIRWATSILLVFLHLVREKPVWHLIGRLSSITGGTGWHRYALIDEFFRHFSEWWLLGVPHTKDWKIPQATDVTNQYILEGVRGGLATLIAFIWLLVYAFSAVGRSLRLAERLPMATQRERWRTSLLVWGIGVCIATHCVAFIGVSYFGQLQSILFLHLAMVPSLHNALARASRVQEGAAESDPQPLETQLPLPAGGRVP